MKYFKIINIWTTKENEKPQTRKDMCKYLTNYLKICLDNNLAMSNKVDDAYAYSAAIVLGINLTKTLRHVYKRRCV